MDSYPRLVKTYYWTIAAHVRWGLWAFSYVIANKENTKLYVELQGDSRTEDKEIQIHSGEGDSTNNEDQMWLIVRA
ncbi:hypothetical protein DICSQDRAFT_172742 [Dichomitus squalens LYAD-421 SS1]|uniref:Ricin B lectin domain-containing protein n=1 Tax=Dichomitus squalens (strain LYAD-421) TaxID=732165 RepID=R7SUU6_DICSQ|nr:uncharacterized protein DICSQDRAFT_172742 [Dichomitus squalens LYAD-421 SS1]EJF58727.1 hypothetical protein DICSQDRAFT_172742 [Dichomitus squalens LYAD-421 SS1]